MWPRDNIIRVIIRRDLVRDSDGVSWRPPSLRPEGAAAEHGFKSVTNANPFIFN